MHSAVRVRDAPAGNEQLAFPSVEDVRYPIHSCGTRLCDLRLVMTASANGTRTRTKKKTTTLALLLVLFEVKLEAIMGGNRPGYKFRCMHRRVEVV